MTVTYEAISSTTLVSAQASVTLNSFSGYTDLIIVCNSRGTSGSAANIFVRFNGDTGSNYSKTLIEGNGSTATSARDTNSPAIYSLAISAASTSEPSSSVIHLMNYSNTTTNKTVLGRCSIAGLVTNAVVGLWRNTAAITSVSFTIDSGNLATGSTFSLYGIKAE